MSPDRDKLWRAHLRTLHALDQCDGALAAANETLQQLRQRRRLDREHKSS